jgi:hypothetical protein
MLSPEVETQILNFIAAGGFPHVAAEAAGVSKEVFVRWLERGQRGRAREPFRSFAQRVRQTAARARLKAEIEAREKDARFWLSHGPGRETSESAGWTGQVKPLTGGDAAGASPPVLAEVSQMWRQILHILEGYPEARAAVADGLRRLGE